MSALLDLLKESSGYYGGNAAFIEDLYESYLRDPESVDTAWRERFKLLNLEAANRPADIPHGPVRANFAARARESHHRPSAIDSGMSPAAAQKQASVLQLITAYRMRGHQQANIEPLGLRERPTVPDLSPTYHRLGAEDMDVFFNTGSLYAPERMPLREIIAFLEETYCGTVGSEYMHITDTRQRRWIQRRLETYRGRPELEDEQKRWLLQLLTAAEGLEKHLHSRYVGQKRFSLEGGEALIPLLDELIQRAGGKGIEEVVLGMAHRGRLNVLTNILGKPPGAIFQEFEGNFDLDAQLAAGDVKYHQGFSSDVETPGGITHLALSFNPSHLEIISPVVEGSVRARQRRRADRDGQKVLPILIHGDAAFAGQGVVMETLNMSQSRGFGTGGTVHVIINNQIGFTTSNPLDTRSTLYCTDVAKMVQAPIFHVNGDDPEAVIFVTRLAHDYRKTFHRDLLIDLVCYRRHGHNEADEPAVTQPRMYKLIRRHPTVRALYAERLAKEEVLSLEESQALAEETRTSLEQGSVVTRPFLCGLPNQFAVSWKPYLGIKWDHPTDTGLPLETLTGLARQLLSLPEGFHLHPRVGRIMNERERMTTGERPVDWGFAENLAYATLVADGYPIRLSGQDSARGTFFHRHAVIHDQLTGTAYTPLQNIGPEQGNFTVIDSLLSEEAVLGFEYGYASAAPESMAIWEAQFGDFVNGAQVVIDQFISSGEAKWGRLCGLVLLLPHGYEGQGPEHSSARLERFLQLCAGHNMQVCQPTTPAQIFHLLRLQMVRPFRKPLVIMAPKSLLRHKMATSPLEELSGSRFQPVIGEVDELDPGEIKRVIACSGKVYYDLLEPRRARSLSSVALIRIEQLYPFPDRAFAEILAGFPNARQLIWCQEEPQNQGAWDQIRHRFHAQVSDGMSLHFAGRPVAASPAVGYYPLHIKQQETLVDEALTGNLNPRMNRRTMV